jgi:hypothetical protein
LVEKTSERSFDSDMAGSPWSGFKAASHIVDVKQVVYAKIYGRVEMISLEEFIVKIGVQQKTTREIISLPLPSDRVVPVGNLGTGVDSFKSSLQFFIKRGCK